MFFAASLASPAVLAMSASHASKGLRPRSFSNAAAMAASFSTIIFSSACNCCLRHSRLRVRPLLNVSRSLSTTAGMVAAGGFTASGATDSVVMVGVLPDPRRNTRS
jgi:hypothetical protein